MNRSRYFNYIEEKLNFLAFRIQERGKLNILDYNLHSESFYMHFLNLLFTWDLKNLNTVKQNAEAIDLIDNSNKIIIQVSATATKDKIESTLNKDLSAHKNYTFKFVSISKDAAHLRKLSYKNPHNLSFNPGSDIFDIASILKIVNTLGMEQLQVIYDFIKKELAVDTDPSKIDSNLTRIINILSQENLEVGQEEYEIDYFEIDRKIDFNSLKDAKMLIEDYRAHFNRVDKIYNEFDKSGVNKSISVLASIRNMYIPNKALHSDDALFFKVIDEVKQRIKDSANYTPMPIEELEMCINILVVDAFIRCKIFENPREYNYAAAR